MLDSVPDVLQLEMTTDTHIQRAHAGPALRALGSATSTRLRILHVVSCLGLGGTEHGVLKVINGLGDQEFEHRVCAVRGIDKAFARTNVASRTYSAGTGKPGLQFPLFRLIRIIKEFRPHVVHTRNFGAIEAIPAARLARTPVTIHSEHGYELDILSGIPVRRRVLCRILYSMADVVFTVTKDLQTFYGTQSWLGAEKLRTLYNGVDTVRFRPQPQMRELWRARLGIPAGRFVIGSVGRLVPIKDHLTLLKAAEGLVRTGLDVQVLLVGSGPEREGLEAYSAKSALLGGRVLFTGASDNVPEMLNAMDAYVLPSICEGMSNTILEAMASALPVIATRAGGNPELVKEGETGWLFQPRDVEALSSFVQQIVKDRALRKRVGEAGYRRVVEQFSISQMIERYRELYQGLARRRGVLQAV